MSSLNILFENEKIIAVEKPANVFIHPMKEDPSSKENNLLYQVRDHLDQYVYAVNRLDRPVSGIVLFTKNNEVVSSLQDIWHADETKKIYLGMCLGEINEAGKFDSPLSKMDSSAKEKVYQDALTLYRPLEFFRSVRTTYLEIEIRTGRYHQIRRHFRKAVHPLIGDRKHGKGPINKLFHDNYGLEQLFLHCHKLVFLSPWNNQQITIDCPLPKRLSEILEHIKKAPKKEP